MIWKVNLRNMTDRYHILPHRVVSFCISVPILQWDTTLRMSTARSITSKTHSGMKTTNQFQSTLWSSLRPTKMRKIRLKRAVMTTLCASAILGIVLLPRLVYFQVRGTFFVWKGQPEKMDKSLHFRSSLDWTAATLQWTDGGPILFLDLSGWSSHLSQSRWSFQFCVLWCKTHQKITNTTNIHSLTSQETVEMNYE